MRRIPQKVLDILCGRGFVAPDAYDDLPAIIECTTDFLRDPWVPATFRGELTNMLIVANERLLIVAAATPSASAAPPR